MILKREIQIHSRKVLAKGNHGEIETLLDKESLLECLRGQLKSSEAVALILQQVKELEVKP